MKLLIVDDEVIIREGLSQVIDWRGMDIHLIGTAASAEEAWGIIERERPDIVLTDIYMTGKSGLQLSEQIMQHYPDTEIVILSGYDEFAYAQEALRQGINEYLLKTSGPDEISKAVLMAKHRLMQKREQQQHVNEQQREIRNKWLERLLFEGIAASNWQQEGADYFPVLKDSVAKGQELRAVVLSATGWGSDGFYRELLLFAVDNMVKELMRCETVRHQDRIVLIENLKFNSEETFTVQRAIELIEHQLKCSVFTAIGKAVTDVHGLHQSYQSAQYTYTFQQLIHPERMLTYDSIKNRSGGRTVCTIAEERELSEILHRGNVEQLRSWVKRTINRELSDPQVTPISIRGFLQSIVVSAHRWLERAAGTEVSEGVAQLHSLSEDFDLTKPLETQLQHRLQILITQYQQSSGTPESVIQQAKVYIKDHLHDKHLTLRDVADQVHWNATHLSEVFKRETGMTYIEFLKQERIHKATEILQETSAKVHEVARQVGYEDVKYFTQLFKQYTGKTPSEYRNLAH